MSELQKVIDSNLNAPQRDAVVSIDGPLLILAGAGSGKTRVLTYRIAQIIASKKAAPHEILSVTFTNKAAREMEHRSVTLLRDLGIPVIEAPWISTFHSIGARILRDNSERLGYQSYFTILDSSDQLSVIKQIAQQMELNDKVFPPKRLQHQINEAKMLALNPLQAKESFLGFDDTTVDVYRLYEDEMKRSNNFDFSDLLYKTLVLFRDHPDILEAYQKKFKYVLVDEYQDTNHIQYLILKMLVANHHNICVVGDEDQSIYSWRGADIRNILDFEKDYPDAKTIKLEENYRSSQNIVEAASAVIKNNTQRKNKTLFSNGMRGNLITVREEAGEYEEAKFVAKEIQSKVRSGDHAYKDFAIFYRTNAQSRVLEEQLRTNSIPYKIYGGIKFYERKEIKDVLCYLRLILNPTDNVAFLRVLNVPARGIGKTTVTKLTEFAGRNEISVVQAALTLTQAKEFNSSTTNKLLGFLGLLTQIRESCRHLSLSEMYHLILEKSQYVERLKQEDTHESQARVENLEEFNNAISQFEKERGEEASLQTFLEEMALVSEADEVDELTDFVTMMTLHISKGLEYPNVFIVGAEDNLFPGQRSLESLDPTDLEEERRLMYVGMTRAMSKLYITHARKRRVWGVEQYNPASRFINEIPKEFLDRGSSIVAPKFMDRYASANESAFGSFSSGVSMSSSSSSGSNGKGSGGSFSDRLKARNAGKDEGKEKDTTLEFDTQAYDQIPDYESETQGSGGAKSFKKGAKVRHPSFGVGTIYKAEGQGEMQKVTILFQDNSIRKFVIKYARLELI